MRQEAQWGCVRQLETGGDGPERKAVASLGMGLDTPEASGSVPRAKVMLSGKVTII